MVDPLTVAVVAAIVGAATGKTTESMIAGGTAAVKRTMDVVKRRFRAEPEAAAALLAVEAEPEDDEARGRFESILDAVRAADADFDAELKQAAEPLTRGAPVTFNNHIGGNASIVQAQHIENLTIPRN